jgi:hypothetical protein
MKPSGAKRTPLRRRRIAQAAKDVRRGLKDTERRGAPNDLPAAPRSSRRAA